MAAARNLVELLRARAAAHAERRAFTFLADGEVEHAHLTYGELDRRARGIAARLQSLGASGERAVLLYPPSLEYVEAFFGCLYAGAVAVPAYPPDPRRLQRTLPRLTAIVTDADARVVLTTSEILAAATALFAFEPELARMQWVATDDLASGAEDEWRELPTDRDALAFLQYTSGSTGAPRGVMLTHANLMHNSEHIHRCFGTTAESRGVSWLPPYHDMGLIGGILQPIYVGAFTALMSPLDFLRRPSRWLRAISRYGVTTSGGPNFAYDLCARKIRDDECEGLDLASWDLAFNGAESVRTETIGRFVDRFGRFGFRERAFYPCYGLAEATLIVSGGTRERAPVVASVDAAGLEIGSANVAPAGVRGARALVGCGAALDDQSILIADPVTKGERDAREIGEIWVSGPSVAQGYWRRDDETRDAFRARLQDGRGPFLRTGDLGFLIGGELFVTGRLKDLIVIRGRNYYPQDIELVVEESHPAVRRGCTAAFSFDESGEERLVVTAEVERRAASERRRSPVPSVDAERRAGVDRRADEGDAALYVEPSEARFDPDEVIGAIRRAVLEQCEIHADAVVLLKAGSIPKTSSGKIQRFECRTGHRDGTLSVVAASAWTGPISSHPPSAPPGPVLDQLPLEARAVHVQSRLRALVGRALRIKPERVDPRAPIGTLGLDSLMAIEVAHGVSRDLGVLLDESVLLGEESIVELARALAEGAREEAHGLALSPRDQETERDHRLSANQSALWFLHELDPASAAYNLAFALRARPRLEIDALRAAIDRLVARHAILRTTYPQEEGRPVQRVAASADDVLHVHDAIGMRDDEVARWMADEAHRPFDLERGPVLRVHVLDRLDRGQAVLVVVHHIAVDLWSLVVLLHELGALYARETGAPTIALPPVTRQYADFVRWQEEMLAGSEGARLWAYWEAQLAQPPAPIALPTNRARRAPDGYAGGSVSFELTAELGAAVRALARAHGATLYTTLLAAFEALLARYSGQTDLVVGTPASGRSHAELAGTCGYFVNTLAIRADLRGEPSFDALLDRTKRTVQEALRHQHLPFAMLVERLAPGREPGRTPLVGVMFVLEQAQVESLREVASWSLAKPGQSIRLGTVELEPIALERRSARFDLTLTMVEARGALHGTFEYDAAILDPETVTRMARHLERLLGAVVRDTRRSVWALDLLTDDEKHDLIEWSSTGRERAPDRCVHELFEARAARVPDAAAVVCGDETTTYAELEARANRLARHLRDKGLERSGIVGILLQRSPHLVTAPIAVLKAGGTYVPLDSDWPAERMRRVLASLAVRHIVTDRHQLASARAMQLEVECLEDVTCLDVDTETPPPETLDEELVGRFWDHVSDRATDRVSAGGFVSSYTSEPFTELEVDEYVERVAEIARPFTGPGKRVLEIGCGAGLIMFELAPHAARYVGVDPSTGTQARNRERVSAAGLNEVVELRAGFAHDDRTFDGGPFDLVLLASTAQFFPGPIYLERILERAFAVLAPGGAVVVADVLDARRREELWRSVRDFKASHPEARARAAPGDELYVHDRLFTTVAARVGASCEAAIHTRDRGFPNELRFRYDVVLRKRSAREPATTTRDESRGEARRIWTDWHVRSMRPERVAGPRTAEQLAYVIFTSGSTGMPKGVAVRHAPVVNVIEWVNQTFSIDSDDRLLFVTSLCFDLSVYDVFGALAAGAVVHVATRDDVREPERLLHLLERQPITFWDSAPAALQQLTPFFSRSPRARYLRLVFLSGDWIPLRLPEEVRAAFTRAQVVSLGGATEATVWSNYFPVSEIQPQWASIPYGKPIANARYYVLDPALRHCPLGVEGDLYIAGECLSTGYINDSALTARKFVPDPFGERAGDRMYATGDRARYWADGNLEFLGRHDQQVKIRGYRIELGEIEQALESHERLASAVVVARDDAPGGRQLVAYVVPRDANAPGAAELRAYVRVMVPEYMVPAAFVALDALPLTPNGKLDRRALPRPEWRSQGTYVAPRTPTEHLVALQFAELLVVDRVGARDDFFALGGHSLVATRLAARLGRVLDVSVPVRAVFEHRTVEALARAIDEQRSRGAGLDLAPVERRLDRSGPEREISYGEERLWFLWRLEPESTAYHIAGAVRLTGMIDVGALELALSGVVERHEVLRTRFEERDGRPVAVVAEHAPIRIVQRAMRDEDELERALAEDAARPFDLSQAPQLRASLYSLAPDDHVLSVGMHHAVSDGWSLGVLVREIGELYAARTERRRAKLAPLPVQYGDYAAWQRKMLAGERLEKSLAHWKRALEALPVLELPTDRPRPRVPSGRGGEHRFELSADVVGRVRALAVELGASELMVLLAAFEVLLGRMAHQDDFGVGTPSAGRSQPELEPLIGFFVSTLVLRADLSGEPTFEELVRRVRDDALDAYANEDAPFERVVQALGVERRTSTSPLFQVMLVLQSMPGEALAAGAAEISAVDRPRGVSPFELTLELTARGDFMRARLEYAIDLFDRATMERFARRYAKVLEDLVYHPSKRVGDAELVLDDEKDALLTTSRTKSAPIPAQCVHELIEARAAAAPDAVAVTEGEHTLTYAELDLRASHLADRLYALGVGRETRVALALEPSLEMVVAFVGVMKAGGAYVPLDPSYPRERLRFMLEDSGAPLVLVDRAGGALEGGGRARIERLGPLLDAGGSPRRAPRHARAAPGQLAYVIYTSGSTGVPKGAMITHRSVVNLAMAEIRAFELRPQSRVLQFSSPSFDAAVWEIFATLIAGATLVVAPRERAEAETVRETMRERGVSVVTLPPTVLRNLSTEGLAGLRTVISAGEALTRDLVQRWSARGRVVVNAYGPTEATVCASFVACDSADPRAPSIGRAVENVQLHVIDGALRLVPPGVPGELAIGGVGVARAYSGRPGLTASRFVPAPFSEEGGARLYRTGDLVRWRADDTLEYLGRIDQQVKVRGLRIELGEIEAILEAHPAIRQAVVVAIDGGGADEAAADRRLAAYVVVREGSAAPSYADLRAHLGARLPSYMLPGAVLVLDALPLTKSGKVDRRALPRPDWRSREEHVPPRTETERVVAACFAELLGAARVGARDDFFALGGHSLIATRLVSRLARALGVELAVRAVFEAPTVEALARAIDDASARHGHVALGPMERVARIGPERELSYGEERLWFLWKLEPDSAAYHLTGAVRLRGVLDVEALRAALCAVTARHEVLRTRFEERDGRLAGVVVEDADVELRVRSVRDRAELERALADDETRPFDLSRAPQLRAQLYELGECEHVLSIGMHHAVSDGWSLGVLVRELGELYAAHVEGRPPALAPLGLRYGDYAAWQREMLSGRTLEVALAYWQRALDALPVLELPTDRPRPRVPSGRGGEHRFDLPPELTRRVRDAALRTGATEFMVLLAAFEALVGRLSNQTDFGVGTPSAGRRQPELEPLVGFFVQTLVLRADLSGDPTFEQLVGRVRGQALDAFAHQDAPFEKIVEALGVERRLGTSPLFQVMFALQNVPTHALRAGALDVELVERERAASPFDLTLQLAPHGEAMRGRLEYASDLFDRETVESFASRFVMLLDALAREPSRRVSDVDLVLDEEKRRLVEWNRTGRDFPGDLSVHALFEAQVDRTPDATALVSGDQVVTYEELDRRANALADRLLTLGARPETKIGLLLDRSIDLPVALLGVLKAGAAYVPLDPEHPRDRLAFVLEDAGAEIVVTQRRMLDRLPSPRGRARVLCIDEPDARLTPSRSRPSRRVAQGQLAYVIYTSGSTGRPKGVAIAHGGVVSFLLSMQRELGFTERTVLLAVTTLSFDIAALELLLPLVSGGAVVLASRDEASDGRALAATLDRHAVDAMQATPATWRMLLDAGWRGHLERLLCGGEALSEALAPQLRARATEAWNLYGPTETTIWSAAWRVAPGPIWIGRPIANTELHVVDRVARRAPLGVAAELAIGGVGLARAYHRRAALTAELFVPDPLAPRPGSRLYRTGDVVRRHAGGELEFLGRADHQVKVRGFRIELGEIETVLESHPAIRQAVVVARGHDTDKRLVATIVVRDGASPSDAELRAHLDKTLPSYMVPSAFVPIDALPLTTSGKIDRRALPDPEWRSQQTYVEPRTATEQTIAAAMAELLSVERVGARDDFFALGGHSLAATRLVSRLGRALGVELPVRAVFESPTVEALARAIDDARARGDRPATGAIARIERAGAERELSYGEERLWFLWKLEPRSSAYHMTGAIRLRGEIDARLLEEALSDVVARHEVLRTRFVERDGRITGIVEERAPIEMEVLAKSNEAALQEALAADATRPFDLGRVPQLRARLYRLGDREHVLSVGMHHAVSDGWSLTVLLRDVAELYAARRERRPSRLAPLPIRYGDYAAWQRARLAGGALERSLAFWKRRLDGIPTLRLATDHPRPALPTGRGRQHRFELGAELEAGVREIARRGGASEFMVLLAAFEALLGRHSGQKDFGVGTPVAGRPQPELEPLVGFFVQTLVIRADLSSRPTFHELVGRVRDASLEAFAHDDAPFERVVAAIQPERDTSVTPLFQALFVLQNAPSDAVRTAGVHFEAVPVDRGTAQLDLTLELSPGAQGGLDGRLEVSGDLFDRASTERLAAHYARLLAAVLREPDRPVDEIDLVGAEERRVLVDEWNATEHAFSRDACMHELFEAQVDRAPDAEALAYEGERLTYRALDERANRLAHRLEALGVGPDVRVAICVERSIDMVVAIYSVLKAGGAYVPLDPEDPPERLGYVIDDARVRVAIVQQQHDHAVARAAPDVARFVIDAPESARALASEAKDRPRSGVSPRNLVYVLYTSGSTGRPKGVLVEHRGVVNRIEWMQHAMRFGPGDAVLQKTPLTFDVAGWELYLPLVSGARLVVAAPKRHGDPAYLSDAIVTDRITAIHFVPSMLGAFLSSGDLARCESLARVFSSGEALPAALVRAFHDRLDAELYNLYGPTEASIDVSAWRCDRDQSGAVPIGRPIWNTQLDVLDDDMAPVPIGLPGELFIGGVQLARAYGGRPSLTADKLVPDPFGREDGARLYRTGDLARFRRDGSLEFLGRIDQQVKLRGFRIELGEIESVLVSHGAIRQTVVVLRGTEADARLVAYVVPNGAAAPSTAELSLFAQNRLPAHMVPSAFVVLDALPLTPSGKVRRAALPEPDRRSSVGYVAPRSETEQTVATLFSELLGVERVGVDDDFFALGGHSLLAVMAVARVKSAFGVDLPLVSLFESRTVAAFALRIVQARATDVEENVLRALLDEIERSPH